MSHCHRLRRRGFTLVEVLVVLILMSIAAALVAPSLLPDKATPTSELASLVRNTRETAVRRGETVYLSLGADGSWRVDGAASESGGPLASGTLTEYRGPAATLIASPIGTCDFDVRSAAAARAIPVNPLTCELRAHES